MSILRYSKNFAVSCTLLITLNGCATAYYFEQSGRPTATLLLSAKPNAEMQSFENQDCDTDRNGSLLGIGTNTEPFPQVTIPADKPFTVSGKSDFSGAIFGFCGPVTASFQPKAGKTYVARYDMYSNGCSIQVLEKIDQKGVPAYRPEATTKPVPLGCWEQI